VTSLQVSLCRRLEFCRGKSHTMVLRIFCMCLLGTLCSGVLAQVSTPPSKPVVPQADSIVMEQIFAADQKPRLENLPPAAFKAKWGDINTADAARREQVRNLLLAGDLHTGKDFWEAAFIFQHSLDPSDYLLAHTLASIALAKGNHDGLWILTATLDRYLQSIHQPQIYGTQSHRNNGDEPFTKEPYNRGLIPDALHKELEVPSQAEQQRDLEKLNKQAPR